MADSKGGRPSKIDTVIDPTGGADGGALTVFGSIVRDLQVGGFIRDAAARAGVHEATVHRWLSVGEEWADEEDREQVPDEVLRYCEFYEAVEKARAQAVMTSLAVIRTAAQGRPAEYDAEGNTVRKERQSEWQAAAWYLERTRPEDFGRRDRHEHTGKGGRSLTDLEMAVDADDQGS